jgi:hypothetical protein
MPNYVSIEDNQSLQRTLVPQGTHLATCCAVIDLGKHPNYSGDKMVKQMMYSFEFPNVKAVFDKDKGEQPLVRGTMFNVTLHEKGLLRPFLEKWLGRSLTQKELLQFDVESMIGKPAMVSVTHKPNGKGDIKDRITGIQAMPEGMPTPEVITPPVVYNIDDHPTNWDQIPNWVQNIIQDSQTYKERVAQSQQSDANSAEKEVASVPF